MRIMKNCILMIAVFLLFVSPLFAEEGVLEDLNAAFTKLYEQGKYSAAVKVGNIILELTEETFGPDDLKVIPTLTNLAMAYKLQGEYEEAEKLVNRVLLIQEKNLGAAHPEVASSLNSLAEIYRSQGRYAEVGPLYERALVIVKKTLGKDNLYVATLLENTASFYNEIAKPQKAEELIKQAEKIRSKKR